MSTKEELLEIYYDLRCKYSKMKQEQQLASFKFQKEIRKIQKLLMNKYEMNDKIDLNKIREQAANDVYNNTIIIDNMEFLKYFQCLIYGYIRLHFHSIYIPEDIKHMCYLFYDKYFIHTKSCDVNVYSDSKLTKLLIQTYARRCICDDIIFGDISFSLLTDTPINSTNKWEIKLNNPPYENTFKFGIISDIDHFAYLNSKKIESFKFEDKDIHNAAYWDNGINIIENGVITTDESVDWYSWLSHIHICFENNKLTIEDSSDTYCTLMPTYNYDGTVINYYFAIVFNKFKEMKYEILISGEGMDCLDSDSDSDSFMNSDDEEQARRLQEIEFKIGHRPSPQELIEKKILYFSTENMAPSIQNTAGYLEDALFKDRLSKCELVSRGYFDTNMQ